MSNNNNTSRESLRSSSEASSSSSSPTTTINSASRPPTTRGHCLASVGSIHTNFVSRRQDSNNAVERNSPQKFQSCVFAWLKSKESMPVARNQMTRLRQPRACIGSGIKLEHCWKVLRYVEKWRNQTERSTRRRRRPAAATTNGSDGEENDNDGHSRPIGRKQAKRQATDNNQWETMCAESLAIEREQLALSRERSAALAQMADRKLWRPPWTAWTTSPVPNSRL
ncbi:hypothetical protein BDB00DRAFT_877141 [Zychaea mexicana]|uniref:uncharacterized protein n=1 Tax=Zychaea mexicana TaxID=64656 RepID=UPI0022FF35A1|nr:uncharacterized protein BDB00DRAFT_877141 [Zychaea mexicana]KAI9488672.1 hypothetical protein BDB00DRAFT_877141 [Zychaea mexicana]